MRVHRVIICTGIAWLLAVADIYLMRHSLKPMTMAMVITGWPVIGACIGVQWNDRIDRRRRGR